MPTAEVGALTQASLKLAVATYATSDKLDVVNIFGALRLDATRLSLSPQPLPSAKKSLVEAFWHSALWFGVHHQLDLTIDGFKTRYTVPIDRLPSLGKKWEATERIAEAWGAGFWRVCTSAGAPLPEAPSTNCVQTLAIIATSRATLKPFCDRLPDFLSDFFEASRTGSHKAAQLKDGTFRLGPAELKGYISQYITSSVLGEPPPLIRDHARQRRRLKRPSDTDDIELPRRGCPSLRLTSSPATPYSFQGNGTAPLSPISPSPPNAAGDDLFEDEDNDITHGFADQTEHKRGADSHYSNHTGNTTFEGDSTSALNEPELWVEPDTTIHQRLQGDKAATPVSLSTRFNAALHSIPEVSELERLDQTTATTLVEASSRLRTAESEFQATTGITYAQLDPALADLRSRKAQAETIQGTLARQHKELQSMVASLPADIQPDWQQDLPPFESEPLYRHAANDLTQWTKQQQALLDAAQIVAEARGSVQAAEAEVEQVRAMRESFLEANASLAERLRKVGSGLLPRSMPNISERRAGRSLTAEF